MDNISIMYENFNEDQMSEIEAGLEYGLDVLCYAKPDYLAIQMRQIRLGMMDELDVSVYNKPEYDWFQMEEIRLGMKSNVSYQVYAKPEIDYKRMRQIRKGLESGMDLSMFVMYDAGILEELRKAIMAKVSIVDYIKAGYVVEQLKEIRKALQKNIDVRPYISTEYRGASIREIRLGLEAGLPVMIYSNLEYNWQQMREIRLGMEGRIDVSRYCNSLYSWQQMRELRLGLEDGLDIDVYKKFLYTASDMERIRQRLLVDVANEIIEGNDKQHIIDESITVFISKDEMEACIEIKDGNGITEQDILVKLKQSGICQGILENEVKSIIDEARYGQTIVIAQGKFPKTGDDGYYEFFFDTDPQRNPNILDDGSVDFKDVKWFEMVTEGQKIARYNSATFGRAGYTVTGKFLGAKKGREKGILKGQGFNVASDGVTYYASISGRISYDGDTCLNISRACTVNNVNLATGNINFDGTIYVKGNVGSGVIITATENIIVDGYVEAAFIKCGGEVFLRKGVNGNGSGKIEAGGNVVGQFFEDVQIVSEGDIVGQYCMNCIIHTEGKLILAGKKGLLIGGTTRAAKGVIAYNIGNKNNLRTVVNVGIGQDVIRQLQKIDKDIENVNRELSILGHSKYEFQNKYAPEVRNTMEIYLKIEDAIYTKELQLKNLNEEKEQIESNMQQMKGSKIKVEGTLFEGAEITVDNVKWKAFSVKAVDVRCSNGKVVVDSK